MFVSSQPRGAPRAPPPPPPSPSSPAPPAPPPPSSLNNLLGLKTTTTTGAPAPPPPSHLLLQRQTAGVSGNEPTSPPVENVNAHFYTFPKEKCKKTKILYWNKLAPSSLVHKKNNVWVENVNVSMDSVNLTKIEELFHCETQPSTSNGKKATVERTASSSNDLNSDQTATAQNAGVSKIFDEVYILDQKTSLKISLFLKQFRGLSLEQIVDLVINNNKSTGSPTSGVGGGRPPDEQMTLERLRGLQKCLVGAEQYIVDVQNYDGDYAKLGMAEKFIWHIGQHKFFSSRLDVKCLQREFDEKYKNFTKSFDTLIDCCRKLRSSQSLKQFLFLVLRVGNYLNLGSSSGPAAGFKISSIKQLNALKATGRSSTTLLHVLVDSAENDDNAAAGDKKPLQFTSQLSDVHSAAKIDYEATKTDLMIWSAETRKLIQTVRSATDPQFVQENESFLKLVDESLKELTVEKVREVETSAKVLQEYFCDDLKLTDLLNLFSEFFRNVERAKSDNEQLKMKEERLAKQKELQELKKAFGQCL
uniref:FH2 domain-containing protein n=1 Tax=Romanomermis culicivorax TaxID=13658 RepID=A0A915JED5_ROMCU